MLPTDWRSTVRVADGSWATELWSRGLPATTMAETACLSHPDIVRALADAYIAAGADFLSTNSFRANRFALARTEPRYTVRDLNLAAARIAHAAAAESTRGTSAVMVAGSIGPSGKILAVREASEADVGEAFAEHAAALAEGGVDVLLLETFSELKELAIAVQAVRRVCALPIIASMSYDSGPQRTRTNMGAEASECAALLDRCDVDLIGCNCGAGIGLVLPVVVAMRAATAKPLWVKPNVGLPEFDGERAVYRQTPDEFAAFVPRLIEAGAGVIGSCCGSTPEHTRSVSAVVHSRTERKSHAN